MDGGLPIVADMLILKNSKHLKRILEDSLEIYYLGGLIKL